VVGAVQLVVAVSATAIAPDEREDLRAETEALFQEARRRTRRRRTRGALAAALLLVTAAAAYLAAGSGAAGVVAENAHRPFADLGAFAKEGELAFVSRGRLWVLDGDSGRLTAVSQPGQTASDPEFSPNGRWLAYETYNGNSGALWLAHADGSSPRLVSGGGRYWLPGGRLVAGGRALTVAHSGALTPSGPVPAALAAWAADGTRYAFTSRDFTVNPARSSSGSEQLDVSRTIGGKRTEWYRNAVSFTPSSGIQGGLFDGLAVLPRDQGILFKLDPGGSADRPEDGLPLYELTAAGTRPIDLGITVGLPITFGAAGTFAITLGGNRYAWLTKSVAICSAVSAHCSPLPTPKGVLSFDPAFSPSGAMLAFVEAPSSPAGNIGQATVRSWYATHSLWLLERGSSTPRRVPGTGGAASPVWSADGRSLLYVSNDALWLLPSTSNRPVRIVAPLFPRDDWNSFFGEIDWADQFAWQSRA
jgi:dipeptidyl aminopeptidase/acylaminoacyl peptidase